jgi:hypothetical protein
MRSSQLATATLAAALAVGCSETTEPPGLELAAIQFKTSFTIPVDESFAAPCANGGAGENIRLTGSNTIWVKETVTPTNNRILRVHFQPDLAGVGETSGDLYRAGRSPGQIMEIERGDGLPFISNVFPQPIVLIGESRGAGTVHIYTRFQLVINNNGVTTVERVDFSAQCQGRG